MRATVLPCYPEGSWQERDPFTNQTLWRGYAIWQLMDVFRMQALPVSSLSLITNVVSSNTSSRNRFVQALMDDKADLCPFVMGMTHERAQVVDYGYHQIAVELVILSKTLRHTVTGDFILKIFDMPTLTLILLSILASSVTLRVLFSTRKFASAPCSTELLIYHLGMAVGQNPPAQSGWTYREKFFAALFSVAFTVLGFCFSGLIVATLMSTSQPKQINALEDLLTMPDVRIIAHEKTFTQAFLTSSREYPALADRMEFRTFDLPSELEVQYRDVHAGSHVLVDVLWNIERHLTVLKHRYPSELFHTSPSLRSLYAAWIVTKEDFKDKAAILQGIAWLTDFGAASFYVDAARNRVFDRYVQDLRDKVLFSMRILRCAMRPLWMRDTTWKQRHHLMVEARWRLTLHPMQWSD